MKDAIVGFFKIGMFFILYTVLLLGVGAVLGYFVGGIVAFFGIAIYYILVLDSENNAGVDLSKKTENSPTNKKEEIKEEKKVFQVRSIRVLSVDTKWI